MTEPEASRPAGPTDYGFSTALEGMLPWEQVADALAAAKLYWISTLRPDGSPHTHPIWGGFVGTTLYIEGGESTRWARNLTADPRVSFGAETNGLHISGRGEVSRGPAGEDFEALANNYGSKLDYRPENDDFWRISPSAIIAIDAATMESFASSITRFTFGGTP